MRARIRRLIRRRPNPGRPDPEPSKRWTQAIEPAVRSEGPCLDVLLLNDCRDQENLGSRALIDGLFRILTGRLPDVRFHPVPSHWMLDAADYDGFVDEGRGLRAPDARFPKLADQFEAVADRWLSPDSRSGERHYVDLMRRMDLVVLNGEGSIYRTNTSAIRELFLVWLARERLGVPAVHVNGMVHLSGVMPILPAMVRKSFSVLDAVALRESCSLANLAEYAPGVEAIVQPDSAFALRPADADRSPAVAEILDQVAGRPFFCFDPGAMPMDAVGGRDSAMYDLVSTLQRVIPTAVLVATTPFDRYIKPVAEAAGALYVDTIEGYQEFMALAEQARFVATGRYHNVILAGIGGTPSIAFGSTSHKVHGACSMFDGLVGEPHDGTDLRSVLELIEAQARSYVADGEGLRTQLRVIADERRIEAAEIGQLVAEVLGRQRVSN